MMRDLSVNAIPDSRRLESSSAALDREFCSLLPFTADMMDDNEFETRLIEFPELEDSASIWASASWEAASIDEEEAKFA